MSGDEANGVPVWALVTEQIDIPDVVQGKPMTPERLSQLRTVLATLADSPITTLEAHPITTKRVRSGGVSLRTSRLAKLLPARYKRSTTPGSPKSRHPILVKFYRGYPYQLLDIVFVVVFSSRDAVNLVVDLSGGLVNVVL